MSFGSLSCGQYISVSNWQDALSTNPNSCNATIPIKPRGTFSTSKSSSQWLNMNDIKGSFYGDVYFTDSIGNNPNRWVTKYAIWPYQISTDGTVTNIVNPNDCSPNSYSYTVPSINFKGGMFFNYYCYINSYSGNFNVSITVDESSATPNTVTDYWNVNIFYPIPTTTSIYSSSPFLSVQRGSSNSGTISLNISSPNPNAQYLLIYINWGGSNPSTNVPSSATFSFNVGCPGFLNYSFYANNLSQTNDYFTCALINVTTNTLECQSPNIYNTESYNCSNSSVNSTKQVTATHYADTGTNFSLRFYLYQNGNLIQQSNPFSSNSDYGWTSSNFNVSDGDNIRLRLGR